MEKFLIPFLVGRCFISHQPFKKKGGTNKFNSIRMRDSLISEKKANSPDFYFMSYNKKLNFLFLYSSKQKKINLFFIFLSSKQRKEKWTKDFPLISMSQACTHQGLGRLVQRALNGTTNHLMGRVICLYSVQFKHCCPSALKTSLGCCISSQHTRGVEI